MQSYSQSRFLLNNATHELNETFSIPLNYATADNPDFSDTSATLWLTERSLTTAAGLNSTSWVIFNKQQTGTKYSIRILAFTKNWHTFLYVLTFFN